VFEVAVDYSQTAHTWKEMLRLWVCTASFSSIREECIDTGTYYSSS